MLAMHEAALGEGQVKSREVPLLVRKTIEEKHHLVMCGFTVGPCVPPPHLPMLHPSTRTFTKTS